MSTCVYPGSFDPFTNGHLDIAARAGQIFNQVVILIASNSAKGKRFIPVEEMKTAIEDTVAPLQRWDCKYSVDILEPGMTVPDYLKAHDTELDYDCNIIRGIRDSDDAVEEMRLSELYKWFTDSRIELIPFIAKPEFRSVSSTLVREMCKYSHTQMLPVPKAVDELISKRREDAFLGRK